jgi:hypothetical protein
MSCCPATSRSVHTIVVPDEWPTGLALHCSCTVAAYPHVLQAWTVLLVHTFYRLMVALMSYVLETCVRALGTHGPSRIGSPARLFFMTVACGPQGTTGCVVVRSPPCRG